MSLGYADKLTFRDDLGGQLGSEELGESPDSLIQKIDQLAELVKESKRIVVFTGAGISTSCGIPDFRGPKGVWTMQKAGKPIPEAKVTFAAAKPSLTHQALVGLAQEGKLKYTVSQNVDCLHLRSGIPRSHLAELHGNCFAERCSKCRHEYIRDFEIETVGFKPTGRKCTQSGCKGILKDHVLDWEDALPADELSESERQSSQADLAICLGTSLQITPACNIPLRTVKAVSIKKINKLCLNKAVRSSWNSAKKVCAGGKLAIVNLQQTPKDKKACLVIHAKCDEVMQGIMSKLGMSIPVYTRTDHVVLQIQQSVDLASEKPSVKRVTFSVCNAHDPKAALPLIKTAELSITKGSNQSTTIYGAPYEIQAVLDLPIDIHMTCKLLLTEAADADKRETSFDCNLRLNSATRRSQNVCHKQSHSFTTQVLEYDISNNALQPPIKRQKCSDD